VTKGGSLTVVGTGIRLVGQFTIEALEHVKRAERLFYLAGEVASAHWLQSLQPDAENLSTSYVEGRPRRQSYAEMISRVLRPLDDGKRVVVAFYGHPGIGVYPAHQMIRRARAAGYPAQMLPGVSSEACLVADLGIDPLHAGWQSHEAWAFVASRPRYDPHCSLVLWQVGLIYQTSVSFSGDVDPRGLPDLARVLGAKYPARHRVLLYEASPFPVCPPRIERRALSTLADAKVRTGTTLYVPPLQRRRRTSRSPRRR
jgi:hypothetical protein